MSSTSGPISSRRAGDNAEGSVIDVVAELDYLPDSEVEHADARVAGVVGPSTELPIVGMCLVETGTLVEIKSSIVRLASGQRGRFYLRRPQHKRLMADAGVYLFAVCEPRPARDVVAMKIVPATIVDDLLADRWRSGGDGRPECVQLAWSRIFNDSEVSK